MTDTSPSIGCPICYLKKKTFNLKDLCQNWYWPKLILKKSDHGEEKHQQEVKGCDKNLQELSDRFKINKNVIKAWALSSCFFDWILRNNGHKQNESSPSMWNRMDEFRFRNDIDLSS